MRAARRSKPRRVEVSDGASARMFALTRRAPNGAVVIAFQAIDLDALAGEPSGDSPADWQDAE